MTELCECRVKLTDDSETVFKSTNWEMLVCRKCGQPALLTDGEEEIKVSVDALLELYEAIRDFLEAGK